MKFYDCEQGTEEWHNLRLGKITASHFAEVISKGRGNAPSKTRESYLFKVLAERMTGVREDVFVSKEMAWGTETEDQARSRYELETGNTVEQVGFVEYNKNVGVSPDGLVRKDGLLEIKCPKTSTQLKRVIEGVFPVQYKAQVQGQLLVTGRRWCDFVSFDPRINSGNGSDYFCVRVHRDEDYISAMARKIFDFAIELENLIEVLKNGKINNC